MSPRRRDRVIAAIGVGIAAGLCGVLGAYFVGERRADGGDAAPAAASTAFSPRPRSAAREPLRDPDPLPSPTAGDETSDEVGEGDGAGQPKYAAHTVNPCRQINPPDVPNEFETEEAAGVTVAYSADTVQEPVVLAHVVAGLLEEAANRLDAQRRPNLTVVVYPTREEFKKLGAPSWSSAFYDGAIRVVAGTGVDFDVSMRSLRHEVMHAELHHAVGCAPIWLHEGLAVWFTNQVPWRDWVHMLGDRQLTGLDTLQQPGMEQLGRLAARRAYAESLAMVLLAMERDDGLTRMLGTLRASRGEADAMKLWERLYPYSTNRDLFDSLARRMFGQPLHDIEPLMDKPVCCFEEFDIRKFGCRASVVEGKDFWIDDKLLCRVDPPVQPPGVGPPGVLVP